MANLGPRNGIGGRRKHAKGRARSGEWLSLRRVDGGL